MNRLKLILTITGVLCATTLISSRVAEAQGGGGGGGGFGFGQNQQAVPPRVIPAPFSAPQAVNVPRLRLRPVQLSFDLNLNPILIPGLTLPLSSQALNITADHNLARQQVTLAIAYLTTNRRRIIAGQDPLYNQIFGGFYDRSNPQFGTYTLDNSHFQRVLGTYATAGNFMEQPTSYGQGGGATLSTMARFNSLLSFDFGERHWGFSNSDSLTHMNANPPQFSGITPPATGRFNIRWDQDDNPLTVLSPPPSFLANYASSIDSAFRHERMDIYGQPNDPNTQFIGDVYIFGTGRYGGDLIDIIQPGSIQLSGTGSAAVYSILPWNSGVNAPVQAQASFTPARLERWEYILSSFTEFTTNPSDPRGGAFWGFRDVLTLLDPSRNSLVFGGALDAENFSRFVALLNANGIVDPRTFPPRGKNGQFTPLVPVGFVAQGSGFIPPN